MWHIATICNTLLQYVTYCNDMWHIATICNILQQYVTYCNDMSHIATICDILQRYVTYCSNTWHIYCDMTYCSNMWHIYWDVTNCSNMWQIYRMWEQLVPLGCFLFADLFRYHNDIMCVESLKRKDIFAPFLLVYYYYYRIYLSISRIFLYQDITQKVGCDLYRNTWSALYAIKIVWGVSLLSNSTLSPFIWSYHFLPSMRVAFHARCEFQHCNLFFSFQHV